MNIYNPSIDPLVKLATSKLERDDINLDVTPGYIANDLSVSSAVSEQGFVDGLSTSGSGVKTVFESIGTQPSKLIKEESGYVLNEISPSTVSSLFSYMQDVLGVLDSPEMMMMEAPEQGGTESISSALEGPQETKETKETHSTSTIADEACVDAAKEIISEAEAQAEKIGKGDYITEDTETGYSYVDPQLYIEADKLNKLLEIMQLIGAILDTITNMRKAVIENTFENANTDAPQSTSDVIGVISQKCGGISKIKFTIATDKVNTGNQKVLKDKLEAAKKRAHDEVYGCEDFLAFADYVAEVVTCTGSKSLERDAARRTAKYQARVTSEYEGFREKVNAEYKAKLSDTNIFNDLIGGDKKGKILADMASGSLIVEIGNGKVDLDRNKLLAAQIAFDKDQNLLKMVMMLSQSLIKIRRAASQGLSKAQISSSADEKIWNMIETADQFQSQVFGAITSNMQQLVTATNSDVDAHNAAERASSNYWSSFACGLMPVVGGIMRSFTDWVAGEITEAMIDDGCSPTQLDLNAVMTLARQLYDLEIFAPVRKDDPFAKLNALERREWNVIARLNNESVVITKSDGYETLDYEKISSLKEELTNIQDQGRMIVANVRFLEKVFSSLVRVLFGSREKINVNNASNALESSFESRGTAFDLKYMGIKNKIEEHNLQLQQAKNLSQLRYGAVGGTIGLGVAIVLIAAGAVTGGATTVGGIMLAGFVLACTQAGISLANAIYRLTNPPDENLYSSDTFYKNRVSLFENAGDFGDKINEAYLRNEDRMRSQVDKLNKGSHISAGSSTFYGDYWAYDAEQSMQVRDELTKLYYSEKLMLAFIETLTAIQGSVSATLYGSDAGDVSDFNSSDASIRGKFTQKVSAYNLKKEMLEDYFEAHNLWIQAKDDLAWSWVTCGTSVISAITSGVGLTAGVDKALASSMKEVSTIAGLASAGVQVVRSLIEMNSGLGEMENWKSILNTIDQLFKYSKNIRTSEIKEAMRLVNEGTMSEDVGAGKLSVNADAYFAAKNSADKMYYTMLIQAKILDALRAILSRCSAGFGGQGVDGIGFVEDLVNQDKANIDEQLGILYKRVQAIIERKNTIQEATRSFTVSLVTFAVQIALYGLKKTGALQTVSDAIKKSTADLATVEVFKDPKVAQTIGALLGGDTSWDGHLGVDTLCQFLFDYVTSPKFLGFITKLIFDAAAKTGKKGMTVNAKEAKGQTQTGEPGSIGEAINKEANDTYASNIELSHVELDGAANAVNYEWYGETTQFLGIMDDFIKSMTSEAINNINLVKMRQRQEELEKAEIFHAAPGEQVTDEVQAADAKAMSAAFQSDGKLKADQLDATFGRLSNSHDAVQVGSAQVIGMSLADDPDALGENLETMNAYIDKNRQNLTDPEVFKKVRFALAVVASVSKQQELLAPQNDVSVGAKPAPTNVLAQAQLDIAENYVVAADKALQTQDIDRLTELAVMANPALAFTQNIFKVAAQQQVKSTEGPRSTTAAAPTGAGKVPLTTLDDKVIDLCKKALEIGKQGSEEEAAKALEPIKKVLIEIAKSDKAKDLFPQFFDKKTQKFSKDAYAASLGTSYDDALKGVRDLQKALLTTKVTTPLDDLDTAMLDAVDHLEGLLRNPAEVLAKTVKEVASADRQAVQALVEAIGNSPVASAYASLVNGSGVPVNKDVRKEKRIEVSSADGGVLSVSKKAEDHQRVEGVRQTKNQYNGDAHNKLMDDLAEQNAGRVSV